MSDEELDQADAATAAVLAAQPAAGPIDDPLMMATELDFKTEAVRRSYLVDFVRFAQSPSFLLYELWDCLIENYLSVHKRFEERVEQVQGISGWRPRRWWPAWSGSCAATGCCSSISARSAGAPEPRGLPGAGQPHRHHDHHGGEDGRGVEDAHGKTGSPGFYRWWSAAQSPRS